MAPADRDQWVDASQDLLDRQVLDGDGRLVCKVDDLELEVDERGRCTVSAILTGPAALAPRLGGRLGSFLLLAHRVLRPQEPGPHAIPWTLVAKVDTSVHLTASREALDVAPMEDVVRRHVIDKLPGADHAG